jgi:hypothetical protein
MNTRFNKGVVRPWVISPEDEAVFQATDPTYEWLFSLSGETLRQHAGQWLAAKDCQLVAMADTMQGLLEELGDVDLQTIVMRRVNRPGWTIHT